MSQWHRRIGESGAATRRLLDTNGAKSNDIYHRVMVLLLIAGLLLLATPSARAALGRSS
jgi:hypothetical protein